MNLVSIYIHRQAALPRLDPDTGHVGNYFAVPIGANAATRPITEILRTVHWTGHARTMQNTLPAHLAVEQIPLDDFFTPDKQSCGYLSINNFDERVDELQEEFGKMVGNF